MENTSPRLVVVLGTRPEAIKLAPVIGALQEDGRFAVTVVATGQHREMVDPVLELFGIAVDHDLDVMRPGQGLAELAATVLAGLAPLLASIRPDALVVQGDTTTVMAAALAGFSARIPVVHVEAGLRTSDRFSPYPEEVNRRIVTTLADLHLAPTARAGATLAAEGVAPERIVVTGNTGIDALRWVASMESGTADEPLLAWADAGGRRLMVVTTHRRESWGAPMASVARAVRRIIDAEPDVVAVVPLHPNPLVRLELVPVLAGHERIALCEPFGYASFARLLSRAAVVLTDSGGVQEEAPGLGVPVLVLRDTTERPEGIEAGVAKLVGTDEHTIVRATRQLLGDPRRHAAMATAVNPYGDGRAAPRAVAALADLLGLAAAEGRLAA